MYVGLDVHKRVCYGTVMDEKGKIVKRGKFSNDPQGLEEFMEGVDEALVAMEAGYCWQPLYDRLEETGHDMRLARPLKVKDIAQAKVKTDKIDSETLAHLLRADLLPESYVPPRDIRELRDRVRRRAFLVGMRTMVKNRVHSELAKRGIRLEVPLWTREGRTLLQGRQRSPLKDLELTERMHIFCLNCHSLCPPGQVICSEKCHETLIQRLEQEFGTHMKVVDLETMKAYSVPLRDIVEGGLRQNNLKYFSEWK